MKKGRNLIRIVCSTMATILICTSCQLQNSVYTNNDDAVEKNEYSRIFENAEKVVLTDDIIKKINKDGRPLLINHSIALTSEAETPLTVQMHIQGGETIDISDLYFDGKEKSRNGIVILTSESDISIHKNKFSNYSESCISIESSESMADKSSRHTISIFENQMEGWGLADGMNGAIRLNYQNNPELLIDIQANDFKTAYDLEESALVYGNRDNDSIYKKTIILWSLNNISDISRDGMLNTSIASENVMDGVGMVVYLKNHQFILDGNDTKEIVEGTTFSPWENFIVKDGCTLQINGILELQEGIKFINNGTVFVGESGEIRYKDKSQLIGVNP